MKICWITNIPSPYRVDFFNHLGEMCDLTVIFEAKNAAERNSSWFSEKDKNFKAVFLNEGLINEKRIDFGIIKYLQKDIFDSYVITNYNCPTNILSILWLKINNIPFEMEVDGGLIRNDNCLKKSVKSYLISSANHWFSTGKTTSEYLLHYGARKEDIKFYPFTSLRKKDIITKVVPKEEKQRLKQLLGISEDTAIISVGRFIYGKGFDVLLRATEHLPSSCGIYIIGGQPNHDYIAIVKELDLKNVHFVEFKSKHELKDYYKACDIFVLPTREDVWGLVINEAMACGLPIITTDKCVAGLELIDSSNGIIIPADNIVKLSEAINLLLFDKTLRTLMAEKSLEKIASYTIENMAKAHIEHFSECHISKANI